MTKNFSNSKFYKSNFSIKVNKIVDSPYIVTLFY
jgi:hypothetical protein